MSDDTDCCGADTTGDTPCQNPAGENGRCWIPSHNDPEAENPHGRDFAINEEDHDAILSAARDGMSKAGCARAAGVDEKSLVRYLEANENFRRTFRRARYDGERKLVKGALHDNPDPAAPDMNGQHARFLLSTSFEYVKTEKREVENTGDEPLAELVVDFNDVDT